MYTSDYDDTLRFLGAVWQPGTFREIRVKGPRGVYGQAFDDTERAATFAAERSDDDTTIAVWVTVNPIDPTTWKSEQKLASDENVQSRTHLIIDGDTVRPKDQNATEAELEAAWIDYRKMLDHLAGLGFPAPLIVFTGNGWQAWFRIDLPASSNLVERFLKALSAQFSTSALHIDKSVHNPARQLLPPLRRLPDRKAAARQLSIQTILTWSKICAGLVCWQARLFQSW